nr:CesT family type III secretion system chaperone [uncultured Pseudomonas sp.]
MNVSKKYNLLKSGLMQLGYDRKSLDSLEHDGHLILQGPEPELTLLVPTEDCKALFVLTRLIAIDPSQDARVMALALNLNLSPAYTLAASIALDLENHALCLRSTHDLSGIQIDNLGLMLEQHHLLAGQVRKILTGYKRDRLAKVLPEKENT